MADLDPCAQPVVPDGGGSPSSPLFVTPALRLPAKAGAQDELPAGQAGAQLGSRLRGNDEGWADDASFLPTLVETPTSLFTRVRQVVFLHALAATGAVRAAAARCGVGAGGAAVKDCAECGGKCNGPGEDLTEADCQWLGNRLARMEAARPPGAKAPHRFVGYAMGAVEREQLAAFEAQVDAWWCVVPAGPDEDPGDWHFAE